MAKAVEELSNINRRVANCHTYNFGMGDADRLAHVDAPNMINALIGILVLCKVSEDHAKDFGDTASVYVDDIRLAVTEALTKT